MHSENYSLGNICVYSVLSKRLQFYLVVQLSIFISSLECKDFKAYTLSGLCYFSHSEILITENMAILSLPFTDFKYSHSVVPPLTLSSWRTFFITPGGNPTHIKQSGSIPFLTPAPDSSYYAFCFSGFTNVDISYKWNHRIRDLFMPAFSLSVVYSEYIPIVACFSTSFLFMGI